MMRRVRRRNTKDDYEIPYELDFLLCKLYIWDLLLQPFNLREKATDSNSRLFLSCQTLYYMRRPSVVKLSTSVFKIVKFLWVLLSNFTSLGMRVHLADFGSAGTRSLARTILLIVREKRQFRSRWVLRASLHELWHLYLMCFVILRKRNQMKHAAVWNTRHITLSLFSSFRSVSHHPFR